jgi:signal peptidase
MTTTTTGSQRGYRVLARALNALVTLVAVLVVLAGIAWVVPSAMGYSRYVITGGSMTGTYDKGSVVFTKPVPEADLKVGDIVTYVPPLKSGVTTLVTHRIHDVRTTPSGAPSFRTQGDNNPDPDPWRFSLDSDTQPVVQFGIPYVGYALIALADPHTRQLIIGIPAGLVGLGALVELLRALGSRPRRRGDTAAAVRAPAGTSA